MILARVTEERNIVKRPQRIHTRRLGSTRARREAHALSSYANKSRQPTSSVGAHRRDKRGPLTASLTRRHAPSFRAGDLVGQSGRSVDVTQRRQDASGIDRHGPPLRLGVGEVGHQGLDVSVENEPHRS